ncbi:MAG: hypothetical protein EHM23_18110 [Acidobacteria bacterium]|nr:MAG: hypothetical protein EHM23_18110 [Acidobacteriota bacterium]
MAEKFSVVFSGRLREGETADAVRVRLAELFRVKPEQLKPFFLNAPSVLRRGLDEATAVKWVAAIEKAGGLCWTEPDRVEPAAAPSAPTAEVERSPEPAHEPVAPAPISPAPPVVPLAAPVSRALRPRKENDVVPFPKCPKCGRLAESLEDSFMRTGVCPQCGLIIRKYASTFVDGEQGSWSLFGAASESDRHWAAFWQSRLWPAYWRGAWYLCCALLTLPALLHVLDVQKDEAVATTIVGMAVWGIQLAVLGFVAAIAGFYCFGVYRNSREVFRTHVIYSAGICAVLGGIGGVLSLVSQGVASVARVLRAGHLMNPVRAAGCATIAFFAIVLYFGFVRLPAEKQLWEYLDGPEYSATVKEARALAGSEFPAGPRGDKYRYYRYVFVEPTRIVDPAFERVLDRLLPDFNPHSFGRQHGPEVNLLVFNSIAFRDELAADRLISSAMCLRLDQIAAEWEQSRVQTAARLVHAFDTRAPIAAKDLRSLAERN